MGHVIVVVWLGDLRFPGLTAGLTEYLQLMVAETARPPVPCRARSRAGWLAGQGDVENAICHASETLTSWELRYSRFPPDPLRSCLVPA
jgi:hypothetical protein